MRHSRFTLVVLCCTLACAASSRGRPVLAATAIGPQPPVNGSAWRSTCLDHRWHVHLATLPTLPVAREVLPASTKTAVIPFWGCEADWPVVQSTPRNIWNELYRDPRCRSDDDPREAAFAARKAALVGGLSPDTANVSAAEMDALFLPEATALVGSVAHVARDYRHSVGIIESLRLNGDQQGMVGRVQAGGQVRRPLVANSNWLSSKQYPYEYEYEYQYGRRYNDRYRGDQCHDEHLLTHRSDPLPKIAPPAVMVIHAPEIVRDDLLLAETGDQSDPSLAVECDVHAAAQIVELAVESISQLPTDSDASSASLAPPDFEQLRTTLNCSSRFFRCLGEAFRALSHEMAERAADLPEAPAMVARPDKNGPKNGPVAATPGYGPLYIPAGLLGL
jgi:hypothetical protein